MKLYLVYDHAQARAAAALAIDRHYQRLAMQLDANHLVHAAKARIAIVEGSNDVFADEARERGMTADHLRNLIRDLALNYDLQIVALDAERRAQHRALAVATQGHQIEAILARHIAP